MRNKYILALWVLFVTLFYQARAQSDNVQLPAPAADKQSVVAKDTTFWSTSLKAGLSLTQASFSSNWRQGGSNNISYTALLAAKADYIRDRHTWRSEADLQYGSVKNAGQGWRKSLDKLYLDSKYGYSIAKNYSLYASLNLLSQFNYGYKYESYNDPVLGQINNARFQTSTFFAPGYLTQSVGIEYKPVDYFFIRFGTGTLRQTFVTDLNLINEERALLAAEGKDTTLAKNFGVSEGKKYRNEVAFQVLASFDRDIAKNINLKARYTGFINYAKLGDPSNWDHRLDATVIAKVTRIISTTASVILIYDKDADDDLQVSQQLGLGLLITIGDLK